MGQEESIGANSNLSRALHAPPRKPTNLKFQSIEHQGLLKLRTVPFLDSVQVSTNPTLFMQQAEISLASLLQTRLNTTKLFTQQDLTALLQSTLYTLAYLQTKDLAYPDLCPQNLYFDPQQTTFKLYPLQLLPESGYQLTLKNRRPFTILSPQMIIGLRCNQPVLQSQLYHRSNVFVLGMILLECASLKPSTECYDWENWDILDREVRERLEMVRRFYSSRFARYLGLMLEYDYTERMEAKEMALRFNREVMDERVGGLRVGSASRGIGQAGQPAQQQFPGQMLASQIIQQNGPQGQLISQQQHIHQAVHQSPNTHSPLRSYPNQHNFNPAPSPPRHSSFEPSLTTQQSSQIPSALQQSQQARSFRNYINMGSNSNTPVQQVLRQSSQGRRSISPARIPGYKPPLSPSTTSIPAAHITTVQQGLPQGLPHARPISNSNNTRTLFSSAFKQVDSTTNLMENRQQNHMPPVPPPPYVDPYGMIGTTAAAGGSNEQLDVLRKSIDRAAAVTASKLVSGDRQQNPVDLAVKMAMKTSGIGLQQQHQQQQPQYNITSSIHHQQQLPQQPIEHSSKYALTSSSGLGRLPQQSNIQPVELAAQMALKSSAIGQRQYEDQRRSYDRMAAGSSKISNTSQHRATPSELAARLALKTGEVPSPVDPMRSSGIKGSSGIVGSGLPPSHMSQQKTTTTTIRMPTNAIITASSHPTPQPPSLPSPHQPIPNYLPQHHHLPPTLTSEAYHPPHVTINYLQPPRRTSQSDTYNQNSTSSIKDSFRQDQESSSYPAQFHLLSGREQQTSRSSQPEYSITKIKEEIQKSRRLIQQLQAETGAYGSSGTQNSGASGSSQPQ